MVKPTPFTRSLLLLALAAICLGGCRDSDTSLTNFWRPRPQEFASGAEAGDRRLTNRNVDIKLAMARSVEKQGRKDRAVKLYLDAVDDGYDGADAYHRLAVLHDKRGDHVASAEFYKDALQRDPHNAEIRCDQGYSLYLQQRWAEAEASLRRAIVLQPELARAHNNLGLLLGRTDRHDESLTEFVRAGCSEAQARANLGLALTLDQRWVGAQEQFELALAADSNCEHAQEGLSALQAVNPQPSDSGWALAGDSRAASRGEQDAHAGYRASLPDGCLARKPRSR